VLQQVPLKKAIGKNMVILESQIIQITTC